MIAGGKPKVLRALQSLTTVVDNQLTKVSDVLNGAYNKLNATIVKYEGKANDIIDLGMKPLNNILKKFIKKLKKIG